MRVRLCARAAAAASAAVPQQQQRRRRQQQQQRCGIRCAMCARDDVCVCGGVWGVGTSRGVIEQCCV